MSDMSAAEGNFTLNHEEGIVEVQSRTMQAFAEDTAEACLSRAGQRATQLKPRVRYPAVDAGHLKDFEKESEREDAGISTAPLV